MFTADLTDRLERAGLAAVLTVEDSRDAVPVARALLDGGVTVIELTFRTTHASEAIRRIRDGVPGMIIGAGTLLNRGQVDEAFAAGAMFGVAPGCNPATIRAAQDRGLSFAPGVATATDIEIAVGNHCRVLKYFPAETSGGLAHLESVAAPFAHLGLRYIPLGGINAGTLGSYLRADLVLCVGGSWLAKPGVVRTGDWETIRGNAAEAMTIVRATRGAPSP